MAQYMGVLIDDFVKNTKSAMEYMKVRTSEVMCDTFVCPHCGKQIHEDIRNNHFLEHHRWWWRILSWFCVRECVPDVDDTV